MKLEDKIKEVYKPQEFPSCNRAGLVRNYNVYYGAFVTADQVEATLETLYARIDALVKILIRKREHDAQSVDHRY